MEVRFIDCVKAIGATSDGSVSVLHGTGARAGFLDAAESESLSTLSQESEYCCFCSMEIPSRQRLFKGHCLDPLGPAAGNPHYAPVIGPWVLRHSLTLAELRKAQVLLLFLFQLRIRAIYVTAAVNPADGLP